MVRLNSRRPSILWGCSIMGLCRICIAKIAIRFRAAPPSRTSSSIAQSVEQWITPYVPGSSPGWGMVS